MTLNDDGMNCIRARDENYPSFTVLPPESLLLVVRRQVVSRCSETVASPDLSDSVGDRSPEALL